MKYWFSEDKSTRLYNDDYINILNCMIDNKIYVDIVITDPPYLHEKGGNSKMLTGQSLDRREFNMKELGDFGESNIYTFLDTTKKLMKTSMVCILQ